MSDLPLLCDLTKMRDRLVAQKQHMPLVKTLDAAALAQACWSDVRQAIHCISTLDAVAGDAQTQDLHLRTIQQSLIGFALILYARATVGGSKEGGRGSIRIRDKLPLELRPVHDELVDLRNKAVAHVHIGSSNDDWHRQHMFLAPTDGPGWIAAIASRSSTFHERIVDSLRRILGAADAVLTQRYQDHLNKVAELFNAANVDMTHSLTTPEALFDCDSATAAALLQSRGPGASATVFGG